MEEHVMQPIMILLIGLAFGAACGSEPQRLAGPATPADAREPPVQGRIVAGSFALHNGGILTLANGFAAPEARIADQLGERLYDLTEKRPECGSRHYVGTSQGVAAHVIDHRARVCKDLVPAELIVVETLPDGSERTLYTRR
jgi:hypothetical protein